jgi:adenosylcobinamide-phosphate synthase
LNETIFLSAFIIDFIFGDPKLLFSHPIAIIGKIIYKLEPMFLSVKKNRKIAGCFFSIAILGFVIISVNILLLVFSFFNDYIAFILTAILASFAVSMRSLHVETEKVLDCLKKNNLAGARKELAMLVSRDTNELEERDIIRSVVETVAENITDGVIAPLFYMALFGVTGAYFYKTVNTLDSMIGYKNEKYLEFGWFAAKFDDVLNFIPARITGALIVIVSFFIRADFKNSLKIMLRDRKNIDSPNSGWPEAAVAGALGIQLGGPTPYFGVWYDKPFIGDDIEPLTYKHIEKTYVILYAVSILFTGILICFMKG